MTQMRQKSQNFASWLNPLNKDPSPVLPILLLGAVEAGDDLVLEEEPEESEKGDYDEADEEGVWRISCKLLVFWVLWVLHLGALKPKQENWNKNYKSTNQKLYTRLL